MDVRVVLEGMSGAAIIGLHVLPSPFLRPSRLRWGATRHELAQALPGDEMSPHPRFMATRAVHIDAKPDEVWPWLVQLGCRRAGWYSYDLLDNGGSPSARRILLEFQSLQVGDQLPMTPDGKMAMPVRQIRPCRAIVLGGTLDPRTGRDADINDPNLHEYFSWVITYALQPDDGGTRLIARNRADWSKSLLNNIAFGLVIEVVSFAMERKMMLGIKSRAESVR